MYERQVRICEALANPTRLRILDLLAKRPYTVSGLQKELEICFLALPEVRQACHFIREVLKAQVRDAQKLPI